MARSGYPWLCNVCVVKWKDYNIVTVTSEILEIKSELAYAETVESRASRLFFSTTLKSLGMRLIHCHDLLMATPTKLINYIPDMNYTVICDDQCYHISQIIQMFRIHEDYAFSSPHIHYALTRINVIFIL